VGGELFSVLTVPIFTGAIGYATNWTGVWMLFYPVTFHGFRLPGLRALASILPRRIQQIPGFMQGGVGWQGIIPSRAAKMGSIAVDKGIAKVGDPSDFYERLDPEKLADHIVDSSRDDIRELVERAVEREHPQLWRDLPPQLRERVHERIQDEFPGVVHEMMGEVGNNIDHLLDVKLMVIRRMEEKPELANRVFRSVGRKELRFIINFGFWFGFAVGIPTAVLTELVFHVWWLLPICGVVIGWVTNWLAIKMIFEPVEERRLGPFRFKGLFLRRQREVSDVYADVIAEDIVNLRNIGEELMRGANADRTREMIAAHLRPAIDRAVGPAQPAVRVAVGAREYDAVRESVAVEGVDHTMTPLTDPEFNRQQSVAVHDLIAERMRELPSADFSEMLRSAMKQDEWLLFLHGAVLGLFGGLLHLALFG
jgi:uncharacterized membrane protein YheB (UPF0754 family)